MTEQTSPGVYIEEIPIRAHAIEGVSTSTAGFVGEAFDGPVGEATRVTSLWRAGALQGAREDEAFVVKCDRTTMTQNDLDNGRLGALVGFAPVRPAEFVILRIGIWTNRATT